MAHERIKLWPDGPPFALNDVGPEVEYDAPPVLPKGTRFLRNVSEPSLTVFRPAAGKANGVGVIVVPGGGWRIHAWTHEGLDVAEWLSGLGYTAFVLRYRVMGTPPDQAVFEAAMAQLDARLAAPLPAAKLPRTIGELAGDVPEYHRAREAAAQDGRRAVAVVRERAKEFDIDPAKVGMIGFSAGAFLTADVALEPEGAPLAFIAPIYGGEANGRPVPSDAPPLFSVVTQDDRLLLRITEGLYRDWSEADRPAELHVFIKGNHGFGMIRQGLPVDRWTDIFLDFLKNQGLG